MNNQAFSAKEGIKQVQVLHMALCMGVILMIGAFTFIFGVDIEKPMEFNTMALAAMVVSLSALAFANILRNRNTAIAKNQENLESKLNHYRTSNIIVWALLEGASLLNVVFYFFMEDNLIFLILLVITLGAMLFLRPTADKFIEDYDLSEQEKAAIK